MRKILPSIYLAQRPSLQIPVQQWIVEGAMLVQPTRKRLVNVVLWKCISNQYMSVERIILVQDAQTHLVKVVTWKLIPIQYTRIESITHIALVYFIKRPLLQLATKEIVAPNIQPYPLKL